MLRLRCGAATTFGAATVRRSVMRTLWAVLWLSFVAALYAGSCWWFPYAPCWCCDGKGRHYRKDGKVLRDCKWVCKGSGRRLRIGRRLWNRYKRSKGGTK